MVTIRVCVLCPAWEFRMRTLINFIATSVAVCGLFAQAEENPAAGTWKLNAAKSTLNGVALPFVQNDGVLRIKPEIFTGSSAAKPPERQARPRANSNSAASVFNFDLSPDGRTLTLTHPGTDREFKAVFDKR